jgi:hypothetical protein
MGSEYNQLSLMAASLVGSLTFFGSWVYVVVGFEFAWGIALGWLPSAILAVIAFALGYLLWPVAIFLVLGVLLLMGFEMTRA